MAGLYHSCFHVPLVHVPAGDSEDEELVTVVEKEKFDVKKKAVTVTDRFRTVGKVLLCENLQDFLLQGKESLGYSEDEEVYAVLEEDGTEVDEEEYFQLIPHRTCLIVMSRKEFWSPVDTWTGAGDESPSPSLSSENLAAALIQHLVKVQKGAARSLEDCVEVKY